MEQDRKVEKAAKKEELFFTEPAAETQQQFYSVAEAVEYLNIHYPRVAPKSEETIRRAIRTKQLKAVMNQGREGHQILEQDLRAFGESKYGKKLKKAGAAAADALRQAVPSVFTMPHLAAEIVPGKF